MKTTRKQARLRRALRTRQKIKQLGYEKGTARFTILRTPRHIYAQVLAPQGGKVLASASTLELRQDKPDGNKTALAQKVGQMIAQRAKDAGVQKVACDRSGFAYHGRVAALVEAAREGGMDL